MADVPSTLKAAAEGALAKTPLPHLLVYIADRALTGTLVLRAAGEAGPVEQVVFFDEGAPAKIKTAEPVAYLGSVLVELGLLDEDGLTASRAAIAESGGLHGELLVGAGRIDRFALIAGLREQLVRKMAHLAALPAATTYSFYAEANLLERYGGADLTPVDPLKLVAGAARVAGEAKVVDATLARLGGAVLRLHTSAEIPRFGFGAIELSPIDLLRVRPSSLADLLAAEVAPASVVKLVVYTLAITRHLSWGAPASPPLCADRPADLYRAVRAARSTTAAEGQSAVARVRLKPRVVTADAPQTGAPHEEPSPPSSRRELAAPSAGDAETTARREAIRARAAGIDRETYFSMLALSADADDDAIRAAYFGLAKQWHPDRLPADLADVRDATSKVFARLSEAFETLSSAEKRARYLEVLEGGGGTPEEAAQIQQILDAAGDFQRAEVYLKKRDWAAAEAAARRAMLADPGQGDYAALHALVQIHKREGQPDASYADLVQQLDGAIEKSPRCERAYFARALVWKNIGRHDAALADFRMVVELNPKNLDAARELRVHEMRRGSGGKAGESGKGAGLLGKLFKR